MYSYSVYIITIFFYLHCLGTCCAEANDAILHKTTTKISPDFTSIVAN